MSAELNISTLDGKRVVSFHPLVKAHFNFWAFTALDEEVLAALEEAEAVIWPQVFPGCFYRYARKRGLLSFPNYDARLDFPGKDGQVLLFRSLGLPHPRSVLVPKIASLGPHPGARPVELAFPLVLKVNDEHEGQGIFLLQDENQWQKVLSLLKERERTGRFGFLLQEFVPSSYDLRVVIFRRQKLPFWRQKGDDFRGNLVQGGRLVASPSERLEEEALKLVEKLVRQTGIDLAAVDFLVTETEVLLNEINYVFGRRALGGRFEGLFFEAVKDFLRGDL